MSKTVEEWIEKEKENAPGAILGGIVAAGIGKYGLNLSTPVAIAVPVNGWVSDHVREYTSNPVAAVLPLYFVNRFLFRIDKKTSILAPILFQLLTYGNNLWAKYDMNSKILSLFQRNE